MFLLDMFNPLFNRWDFRGVPQIERVSRTPMSHELFKKTQACSPPLANVLNLSLSSLLCKAETTFLMFALIIEKKSVRLSSEKESYWNYDPLR